MITRIAQYYGFTRPFRFNTAIRFLLTASSLLLLLSVAVVLSLSGGLTLGTARFYFLSYVAVLLLAAVGFSAYRVISYAILSWCLVECVLAIGTNLSPGNSYAETVDYDFGLTYHPLLQAVPKPHWRRRGNVHNFDVRDRDLYLEMNWPMNWSKVLGRDLEFVHNSLGMRGIEPEPNDLEGNIVVIYGGSTTYDNMVSQGETWPERLQERLRSNYTILNAGVVGYSTVEHLIQTAFYQDIGGRKPVCAVYYIGWNDMHNAHIHNLDRAYADWHLLMQNRLARKPRIWAAKYSPLARLADGKLRDRFDSLPAAPNFFGMPPISGPDERLESVFLERIRTLVWINRSRGVSAVFVGQILNREMLSGGQPGSKRDEATVWSPLVSNGDLWPLQERFNAILKHAAVDDGAAYIDPGVENFSNEDFVDQGHFSPAGSSKFAALISEAVDIHCTPEGRFPLNSSDNY